MNERFRPVIGRVWEIRDGEACLATADHLVVLGWRRCDANKTITEAGALVTEMPRQAPAANAREWTTGDFVIRPLADFSLQARVLSREDYRLDTESELAPTDLALG